LADGDAVAAFKTIRRLIANPDAAIALLRACLQPAGKIDGPAVRRWLAEIDSEDFAVRQSAAVALEKLGDQIDAALRAALDRGGSLETKRRLEGLLAKLDPSNSERLRFTRALEVLEQIASSEAISLIDALANGSPQARATREAGSVRDRLLQLRTAAKESQP
jgi:phage FluMu protein gp41